MQKRNMIAMMSSLFCCITLNAYAQDQAEIKGSVDGEYREWYVLREGSDSNASFIEVGDQLQIDITGFAQPNSWDAREALAMSFVIEDEALVDAEVVHLISNTAIPPLYTSTGGTLDVSVNQIERNGPVVHIRGQIEGDLMLQEALGSAPSSDEGIGLDVQFDVEARKVEF